MPRSRITRTALGCSGLGWLPALHALDRAARELLEQRLGHLGAGAVAGAQEQHPRARAPPCAPAPARREPQRRDAAPPPALGEQLAAAREVERVVGVAAVGRAAPRRHQPAVAQLAQVVGDQVLRLARPARSAPAPAGRCAPARSAAATAADAPPAAESAAACSRRMAGVRSRHENTSIEFDAFSGTAPATVGQVRVGLLGPLEVERRGPAASTSAAAGCARCSPGSRSTPAARSRTGALVDAVWEDDAAGRRGARAAVARLPPAPRARRRRRCVAPAAGGYRLASSPTTSTRMRFERARRDGRGALRDGDPERAATLAARGARRCGAARRSPTSTGQPLRRRGRRGSRTCAWPRCVDRVEAELAARPRRRASSPSSRRCAAEHPLHERARRAAASRALYAAGRQADALAAYERIRARARRRARRAARRPSCRPRTSRSCAASAAAGRGRAAAHQPARAASRASSAASASSSAIGDAARDAPARHAGRPRRRGQDAAGARGGGAAGWTASPTACGWSSSRRSTADVEIVPGRARRARPARGRAARAAAPRAAARRARARCSTRSPTATRSSCSTTAST